MARRDMVFDVENQTEMVELAGVTLRRPPAKYARTFNVNTNDEYVPLRSTVHSGISRRSHRINPKILYEDEVSDDSNYMDCGSSPSPDNTMGFFNESFQFSFANQHSIPLTYEKIRRDLTDHMRHCLGDPRYFDGIENKKIMQENLEECLGEASETVINICLLWAAFQKRWDLLEGLCRMGASFKYTEPSQGLSALHLSAFSGCIGGTQFLISQGCDVNESYKYYSPLHCAMFGNNSETAMVLLQHGAELQAVTRSKINSNESGLHCAVRVNSVNCVRLLAAQGADVSQVELTGMSPIHLAAELNNVECLTIMLKSDGANVNAQTKGNRYSALHLAVEAEALESMEVLLDSGADANIRNDRDETALHLAVKSQNYSSVQLLLTRGEADPNLVDCKNMTPLHLAAAKTNYNIIDVLVRRGADVNAKGQNGYTPLHIAAINELPRCAQLLASHGADITAKSDRGTTVLAIVRKKTPVVLETIRNKLDQSITFAHHPGTSTKEVELTLDFRPILQHCHPKEIRFLNTFVDEGLKEMLQHPLCSAFLYLKWKKIKKYYIARLFFCLVFVLSLSLYVLTALAHNCYNRGKIMEGDDGDNVIELCETKSMMGHVLRNNPFVIEMQWFALVAITVCEILRKLYGLIGCKSFKQYFLYPDNIIEWFVIISVFVISFVYTGRTYTWQNHVGAFAVLFAWTDLMLNVGQLPVFGPYVAMYTKIQAEFAKLLLAYSCLLIGFAISFCVIFPDSNTFANPFIGFITVITMMIGELNLDILADDDPEDPPLILEISAQVTFVLFLLFITIILMNLLVGIAVGDIQGLQKTAGLSKLVRQTKLISYIELALFDGYLANYVMKILHWTLISPKTCKVAINVKPLNLSENTLPKDVLEAAYEVAKKLKDRTSQESREKLGILGRNDDENAKDLSLIFAKIEENAEKVDSLMNEMQELRDVMETINDHLLLIRDTFFTAQEDKN
ncbi:uncharacterized protein LOC143204233 [Rhynchophorus ferrugineus]|uniref:uncharacterized protein LOC143204233 n=1 Tax=Rhynchophorus ferrugineus TaxID=354439 RepID=UPI003FCEB4A6